MKIKVVIELVKNGHTWLNNFPQKKWGKWYIGNSSGYQSSENGFQLTFQYSIWVLCSILWKYRKLHDLTHSLRHLSRANLQPSGLIQIYRLKTGKKLEHCEFHTTSDDTGRDWPGPSFRQQKKKGPEGLVKKQEENCWKVAADESTIVVAGADATRANGPQNNQMMTTTRI